MQPRPCLIAVVFICLAQISEAQKQALPDAGKQQTTAADTKQLRNFIKTNITSIPFKNYSLQYERVLSKMVSVAVAYRTMPSTCIPFKSIVLDAVGDDPDTKDIIERTKLSNNALTPEVRFYLGKGYGKGFYIAPFYRHVKFSTNEVPVSYTSGVSGKQTVTLSGDLTANTGGLLLGAQWLLGKHLCLDWWIIGAHYGSGNGDFNGVPSTALTLSQQQEIKQNLDDIDIPLTDKTVTVTANNVAVKLDGPFGGLRGGISIGFRF